MFREIAVEWVIICEALQIPFVNQTAKRIVCLRVAQSNDIDQWESESWQESEKFTPASNSLTYGLGG